MGKLGSGRATAIPVVQTAKRRKGDDLGELGRLCGAMVGGVLAHSQVHSVLVVPVAELAKQALGVPFAQHDQVVKTLAAKGADHPLREGVHERRSRLGRLRPEAPSAPTE
jgi:hypothetical protein